MVLIPMLHSTLIQNIPGLLVPTLHFFLRIGATRNQRQKAFHSLERQMHELRLHGLHTRVLYPFRVAVVNVEDLCLGDVWIRIDHLGAVPLVVHGETTHHNFSHSVQNEIRVRVSCWLDVVVTGEAVKIAWTLVWTCVSIPNFVHYMHRCCFWSRSC